MNTLRFYSPVYWPVWFALGLLWLTAHLPYFIQLQLGKCLGWIMFFPNTRLKRTARTNIAMCFPNLGKEEQKQLLRKNFISLGIAVFESGLAWFGSERKLRKLVHIYGLEHWHSAKMNHTGVLFLGIHFLTLELIGRLFVLDQDFAIVYRAQKKPFIDFFVSRICRKCYPHVIERSDVRLLLKALKNGQSIWYTPDIDAGFTDHLFISFFGVPAATFTGTIRLLKATQAKVIPCAYYRREDNKGYDMYLFEALKDFPSGSLEEDLKRMHTIIEEIIHKHPDQYLWQYKRFKTRPKGEKDFYA